MTAYIFGIYKYVVHNKCIIHLMHIVSCWWIPWTAQNQTGATWSLTLWVLPNFPAVHVAFILSPAGYSGDVNACSLTFKRGLWISYSNWAPGSYKCFPSRSLFAEHNLKWLINPRLVHERVLAPAGCSIYTATTNGPCLLLLRYMLPSAIVWGGNMS